MVPRIALWTILLPAGGLAATDEAELLGGPCLPPRASVNHGWHALVMQHSQAERRGDRDAAINIAKQIVRGMCSSEHWWLKLAESLAKAGRIQESIGTLAALYDRSSNALDERLRSKESPLRKLVGTEEFRRSDLAARLARNNKALNERLAEVRRKLAEEPRPPEAYVAQNACPFECCAFRAWTVVDDTVLYDRPGGNYVAARVAKGEVVDALTGEVYLRPRPVRVRVTRADIPAREGMVVFLLDYLGEGMGRVWLEGKMFDANIAGVRAQCTFAGSDCWGELLDENDISWQREAVWWVQIQTRAGVVGWTREAGHFTGADRCG